MISENEPTKTSFLKIKQFATNSRNDEAAARSHQAGVTLVELIIAITIFAIVITSAFGLMEAARASRSTINQQLDSMQSVRSALNSLGRDVLNAGYGDFRQSGDGALMPDDKLADLLGLPAENPANTLMDNLPTIVPGDGITPNSLSGLNTDQITFLYQDFSFNNTKSLLAQNGVSTDGSTVTVQSGANQCRVNDLIIISNSTTSAIGMVTAVGSSNIQFQANDLLGLNRVGTNSPIGLLSTQPATVSRVILVTYRVLNDGTLVRTTYGNNANGTTAQSQKQDVPLVYGVENMAIEYVLANGQETANPPLTSMQNVRQVRVTLTVQSAQKDTRTNQPQKLVLSSTFSIRNLNYDRQ